MKIEKIVCGAYAENAYCIDRGAAHRPGRRSSGPCPAGRWNQGHPSDPWALRPHACGGKIARADGRSGLRASAGCAHAFGRIPERLQSGRLQPAAAGAYRLYGISRKPVWLPRVCTPLGIRRVPCVCIAKKKRCSSAETPCSRRASAAPIWREAACINCFPPCGRCWRCPGCTGVSRPWRKHHH